MTAALRVVAAAAAGASSGPSASSVAAPDGGGHVLLRVGRTTFALPVREVQEVVRTGHLVLLPASGRTVDDRPVALCDVRGRAVPVIDLRADPDAPGDVVVPVDRTTVGAVVDRVVAVVGAGALEPEDVAAAGLPGYARGVLRPVAGGEAARVLGGTAPVLEVVLPELVAGPSLPEQTSLPEAADQT